MEFQFYKPEESIFGETIKPYDPPAKSSHTKSVILSGFPYDEGTRINGGRIGGSVASTIFRKTLQQHQIYPSHSVLVYDAGDIESDLQLPEAHKQLQKKHQQLLIKHPQSLIVSIGGSNDQSYPNVAALLASAPQKIGVINIDAHFDVRPLKDGKAHSGSPFRLMLEDSRFLPNGGKFIQFACKGATCSINHYHYLHQKGVEVYWMDKTIRRHKLDQTSQWRTQGGQMFAQALSKLEGACQTIFVSFDTDSISSKWMPGVSAPSVVGGLTSEQALEIVRLSGRCSKVRVVDFSEFNPASFVGRTLLYTLHELCAEEVIAIDCSWNDILPKYRRSTTSWGNLLFEAPKINRGKTISLITLKDQ